MNRAALPKRMNPHGLLVATLLWLSPPPGMAHDAQAHWPGFLGLRQSIAEHSPLPLRWSDANGVAWRATVPGVGQSSPVVWGGRVFVTAVEGDRKETLHVLALDIGSGKEIWRRQWNSSFPEKASEYVSLGAPTPVVDADRVYVLFESGDLIAMDHEGTVLWRRDLAADLGPFEGNHGQASSPILAGDAVVVLLDHKGPSCLVAVDRSTGETLWKTDRNTTSAWSSPVLVEREGHPEILTSASGSVIAYDPAGGGVRWKHEGLDGNDVQSPASNGSLALVSSRRKGGNLALRVGPDDRVTVAWTSAESTCGFGSPLLYKGRAYWVSDAGVVYCHRAETGEPVFDTRIGGSIWAPPLAAGDRIYFFGKNGKTTVLQASDKPEVLAENQLEVDARDRVYGYAVAPGRIVFRMGSTLVCVGDVR